ncbi:FimV family protein [Pseudomonas sp. R5(2019)]|uniref:type IV pilus assembly protein FimV n=1 Tax=Pseudomonas sp. R5(2019) TaxID=2697566 RepID=UPI001412C34D|nr:peptidoglycan-binding protein LysM [Pseudomonas sp. R5(2019)]NBA97793.1 peptidoglycan-binding protein LysM [Pseudomonas sp. R5(2019)]
MPKGTRAVEQGEGRAKAAAILFALMAMAHSGLTSALGLGDITLRSYLNQPFSADIELLDATGMQADELKASLASAEEFSRTGVDRLFFFNDLRFTTVMRGTRPVIHVTSSKAVTEPYLSFLVQLNRPNGQQLRDYTVLLDPPGTVSLPPEPAPAATAPESAIASSRTAQAPSEKPAAPATGAALQASAEQLANAILANQRLQTSLDEAQARIKDLEVDVADKTRQITALENELASLKAATAAEAAPAPEPQPAPATPASPQAVAPTIEQPVAEQTAEGIAWWQWGAVALLLALLAVAWRVRRKPEDETDEWIEPLAPESPQAPASTLTAAESSEALPSETRREAAASSDPLDAASIYITYRRFNEALVILREGVEKEPERTDLRFRMLEVLGELGDAEQYEQQEAILLEQGFSAQKLQDIRARFAKLSTPDVLSAAPVLAAPVITTPVETDQEPAADFQLNLNELSMATDWDLISPFDTPTQGKPDDTQPNNDPVEPPFASSPTELPQALEMEDGQFLSDYTDGDEASREAAQFFRARL